jgi:hypothetical protein
MKRILVMLCLVFAGCATGMVAHGEASGDVETWFDGNILVVDAQGTGSFDVSMKRGEIVYGPFQVEAGWVYAVQIKPREVVRVKERAALPAWALAIISTESNRQDE